MNASRFQNSAQASLPKRTNGFSSLIWVTCALIAPQRASSTPLTSTQAVTVSSGTSIRADRVSHSVSSSGDASSGADQKLFSPSASMRSRIASRTEAGIACS